MNTGPPGTTTVIARLRDFLETAITREENYARSAGHGFGHQPLNTPRNAGWTDLDDRHNVRLSYDINLIRTFSPDRVLTECATKRDVMRAVAGTPGEETVLRALAAPFAVHHDYGQWDALERHERVGRRIITCTVCGETTELINRDFADHTTAEWETAHTHGGQS